LGRIGRQLGRIGRRLEHLSLNVPSEHATQPGSVDALPVWPGTQRHSALRGKEVEYGGHSRQARASTRALNVPAGPATHDPAPAGLLSGWLTLRQTPPRPPNSGCEPAGRVWHEATGADGGPSRALFTETLELLEL
jgi:hypothetical protein